jgi:MoxR-like ATPase
MNDQEMTEVELSEVELSGQSRAEARDALQEALYEIKRVIVGQDAMLERLLVSLLAGGHVLLEGVPGLAKTLTVKTLASVLGGSYGRIQFTPDLVPSDLVGTRIYRPDTGSFDTELGPVLCNFLLADEINRAPAKTHSALLEIMQESRVTIDGVTHAIEPPFLVMATQNPIESEGTYNLPEAQLDRFLLKLVVDYPSAGEEIDILRLHTRGQESDRGVAEGLAVVTSPEEVREMQKRARDVLVDEHVLGYISSLVRKTRQWPTFSLGASPRAGVAILRAARAVAALEGRSYILPDDVQDVVLPALRHRVMLTPEAEVEGRSPDELLTELIRSVEVPLR